MGYPGACLASHGSWNSGSSRRKHEWLITALAIVIGVLGGATTWLYVGPIAAFGLQIWATFIAWACFYHVGGGEAGLKNTIAANIWGAICATVALF